MFGQDSSVGNQVYVNKRSSAEYRWRSPPEGWVKVNVDASRRHWMKSTSISYIMRDHHSKVIGIDSKTIGDCVILMAVCLAVHEAIRKAGQKGISGFLSRVTFNWLSILSMGKLMFQKKLLI